MRVMECINIRPDQIGTEKKANCKFTNVQVLNLLVLFPFFVVRNAYRYSGSSLSRLFSCEKDMFYRFMNDGNIKWRKLLYAMNLQLLRKISRSTEAGHDKPVCLIIDDTDAPKSGRRSELIGKVFSHIQHKSILGYKRLTKHNRTLRCTYCTIDVKFAGTTVRLFFSKRGRNGHWNGLLTTDLSLSFLKAYRTYATRWTTEVAYHDCKQLLDFGRCQSVHFSAQIASFTLTMMQYNILCTVKRFEAYETVGALFREATAGTLELSASDRIWELILDAILEIAEIISADASELLSAVIDANPMFHRLYQMYKLVA